MKISAKAERAIRLYARADSATGLRLRVLNQRLGAAIVGLSLVELASYYAGVCEVRMGRRDERRKAQREGERLERNAEQDLRSDGLGGFPLTAPATPGPYGLAYWVCKCWPLFAIDKGSACPRCGEVAPETVEPGE